MACFSPLPAWQTEGGEIVFVERGKIARSLTLPCGQCIGCRLERSRQWAVRCVHEAQLHDHNQFVTLTYRDESLPYDGSLRYRHFQLFMKRVRRKYGPVRFFMCGEYGEQLHRPHYHACLFGLELTDKQVWSVRQGVTLYRSPSLEVLWPHGYVTVGDVTFESASYVARYVTKKVTGKRADEHYTRVNLETGELRTLTPEFVRMSLKPGIGAQWIQKFQADCYTTDTIHLRGSQMKPPRYYDKRIAAIDDDLHAEIQARRYQKSLRSAEDSTPERLAVREKVARARLALKKRSYEENV